MKKNTKKKEITDPQVEVPKKKRKEVAGAIRHKANTQKRMIATVGKVVQKYGYPGLTYNNIAQEAGVDRRLIYTYFESIDKLTETYIAQNDFWNQKYKTLFEGILTDPKTAGREDVTDVFQAQFEFLIKNKTFQKLIHWELGEKRKSLRKNADARELMGEPLLQLIDPHFEGSDEDIRATLAIILSGIYYLTIHANVNGSSMCGIDINKPEGKERIMNTIERIIHRTFEDAEK